MYTISRNAVIDPNTAVRFIIKHSLDCDRYDRLYKYYTGEHKILDREKEKNAANNKLICNHAKYITDCVTGFFLGVPVRYQSRSGKDISLVRDILKRAESDTQDIDLARYGSIFGTSYEMIFCTEEGDMKLASLDPRSAFVVYDNTVEQRPMFGVYYLPKTNSSGVRTGFSVYLCDRDNIQKFELSDSFRIIRTEPPMPHLFGDVPITEFYNNWEKQGDFEQVTTLIDAYNTLQSDRVNDKEQFVNSILVIKGQVLGDTPEEEAGTYNAIRKYGVMTIDDTGDVKWLTRQFDESSVDVLRQSIENDIHKFSGVPCLNDDSFAGNSSGVAMKYKLVGIQQMTKIKERYFTEGLRARLRLLSNALYSLGKGYIDVGDIDIIFTHDVPENEEEKADIVSKLRGLVPDEQLVKLLPYDLGQ